LKEILRLEHVSFCYEDRYPAQKDVCVAIGEGERIAVLGGNGAGKSTFFLCCNGILRPQKGKIFLRGREMTFSKEDIRQLRQSVGLVFQESDSQIIAGTVESEVSFGPMNLRLPRAEVAARVSYALEQMTLCGYQDRAPQYLSGGEKKKVCIADILAMKPELLLLDEPTASLDPGNVSRLEQTLGELSAAGMSLVVSTHDVDFAYRFADRGIVFHGGEVIADGSIAEVFESDALLSRAGLKKPLLYAAAELMGKRFGNDKAIMMPRSIREFENYVENI